MGLSHKKKTETVFKLFVDKNMERSYTLIVRTVP